jgi:hypothetical protein
MKKLILAVACSTGLLGSAAHAECLQSLVEIVRSPDVDYYVQPTSYDDILEVYVNETLVRSWRLNQDLLPIPFKLTFLPKRINKVRFVGINRYYQKAIEHDRNPGDVGFRVTSTALDYRCTYPYHWEWPENQTLFNHTYNFVDPNYPSISAARVAKKPKAKRER